MPWLSSLDAMVLPHREIRCLFMAAYLPAICAVMGRDEPEPRRVGFPLKAPLAELNMATLGHY